MNRELPNKEQNPQQKRIAQAERQFLNARIKGFPEPLAAKYAAQWNAIGVEKDPISQKAWGSLTNYAQATSMNHPSLTDIMQIALEKRLVEKPPTIEQEADPEREQAVLELLSQPEFTENQQPFLDLEELYEEFKTIAKKYSTTAASDYWLFTRNVGSFIQPQLQKATEGILTQGLENTFFQELSAYLDQRAIEELQLEKVKPENPSERPEKKSFSNLDDLYLAYKRFTEQSTAKNAYQAEVEWLASLDIQLPQEDRKKITGTATLRPEDTVLSNRHISKDSPLLTNEEMKGLQRLLSRRKLEEDREHVKNIETQRELIAPPKKQEVRKSPNRVELDAFIENILNQVEPLLGESSKEVSDTLKEVAEQEYDHLPEHLKTYLQESTHESGAELLQDTPQNVFARILLTRNGSRVIKQRSKEKKEKESLPWYKRLFKRK